MVRIFLVARLLGALIVMMGAAMLLPWLIAVTSEQNVHQVFLYSTLGSVIFGLVLFLSIRSPQTDLSHREAFVIVTFGWIIAAFIAAIPYWLYGLLLYPSTSSSSNFPTFTSAFFESMSGLTTTGSTIIKDIDSLPQSILFWRSLTHWLGGMGIILLGVAILPFLGVGGMQLYKAEVSGPTADKLQPRIAQTAKSLWFIYLLFTGIQIILLKLGGMSFFDSICHSFSTMATGGFSNKSISIEAYQSIYIELVIIIFMILAGISFSLHFAWLRGNTRSVFKNEELRFYLIAILIWSIAIALSLTISGYYRNFLVAIRYASFQVVSIITSTGFSSCNFDDWMRDTARGGSYISLSAIFWLMTLFFIGGCAGSTGGGIKCIRIWILIKTTYRELIRLIHPQSVIPIKINGRVIPEHIINSIVGFFMLYLILTIVFTLTMTWLGLDLFSAFMAVIASIGNTGPGLAKVGPYENYSSIPIVGQWLLIFCMLLGRLELYTVIILLIPSFWKK